MAACSTDSRSADPVESAVAPSGLQQIPLTIASSGRAHRFLVEVARTPEEQARGLMFRQSLEPDRGMLFPFDQPLDANFWMKNTFIPLDMIFIDRDRTIVAIETARPQSLEPVGAGQLVAAVLEIPGGRATQLGIRAGDKVTW
jgi:uncharacterized membrane protein (UPF0127 family)